mmetsp:Transcript_41407/g.64660  ORF Transcript_41407/g.64660 Transcript_41407/m.64660 type:complete len:401 (+) Transcript_41407:711-1913(+)
MDDCFLLRTLEKVATPTFHNKNHLPILVEHRTRTRRARITSKLSAKSRDHPRPSLPTLPATREAVMLHRLELHMSPTGLRLTNLRSRCKLPILSTCSIPPSSSSELAFVLPRSQHSSLRVTSRWQGALEALASTLEECREARDRWPEAQLDRSEVNLVCAWYKEVRDRECPGPDSPAQVGRKWPEDLACQEALLQRWPEGYPATSPGEARELGRLRALLSLAVLELRLKWHMPTLWWACSKGDLDSQGLQAVLGGCHKACPPEDKGSILNRCSSVSSSNSHTSRLRKERPCSSRCEWARAPNRARPKRALQVSVQRVLAQWQHDQAPSASLWVPLGAPAWAWGSRRWAVAWGSSLEFCHSIQIRACRPRPWQIRAPLARGNPRLQGEQVRPLALLEAGNS